MQFAKQEGAKQDGRWASFETPEQGFNALKKQISLDANRGKDIKSFISKYAPDNENDTTGYAKHLITELKSLIPDVNENTKLSDILATPKGHDALALAISKKEDINYYNDVISKRFGI